MRTPIPALLTLIVFLALAAAPIHSQPAACAPPTQTGEFDLTLDSGGLTREYTLYVPASYDGTQAVPLVLSLHGFLSSRGQQALWSKWHALAEDENFIALYPQGAGMPSRWNAGRALFIGRYDVDDVGFIRDLIAHVSEEWCIDSGRVYVTGLSNGAGMSNRLACELSDTIAAIGTTSGAYTEFPGGCNPTRPVPVIAFHGTGDRIVPFEGSGPDNLGLPNVGAWALNWALRNGCDSTAVSVPVNRTVMATAYTNCDNGGDVILYVIGGGGHVWPGDNPSTALFDTASRQIDATATMWQFFQAHTKTG